MGPKALGFLTLALPVLQMLIYTRSHFNPCTLCSAELIFLKYFVTITEVGGGFGVGSTYSMSPVCSVLSEVILTVSTAL